jgi:hypothetical protein
MTRFGAAPVVHKPVVHKDALLQGKRKPGVRRDPDKRRAYKTAWQARARASTKSGEASARQKEPVAALGKSYLEGPPKIRIPNNCALASS